MNVETIITNPAIEDYISSLYPPVHEVFREMEDKASRSDVKIVGRLVGRVLCQICLLRKPKTVFEMGSGFGYSALWFAISLDSQGVITCTDKLEENAALAREYFARAGQTEKLRFVCGDAIEILEDSRGEFDIILNDIDKEDYPRVVELAWRKLNPGGILITDNALWKGTVVNDDGSQSARGVAEFNRLLFSNSGFFSTVIPLRDGIAISVKI